MKNLSNIVLGTLLVASVHAGCADEGGEFDELAVVESDETTGDIDAAAKADGTDLGVATFYSVEQDMRRCVSPLCGGKVLKRLNRTTTICHKNDVRKSCYVPALDFTATGLSEADIARATAGGYIVRGAFAAKRFDNFGNLGTFKVTEIWTARGELAAQGTYVRIKDTNARCIAAPCFNKHERAINGTASATISDIDWANADLDETALTSAIEASLHNGVIVAGTRYTYRISGRVGKGRRPTAVFTKAVASPASCYVGGCSNQVCSDEPGVITTCEYRPEYACYSTTTCERQPDGACGWTPTPELTACLQSAQPCYVGGCSGQLCTDRPDVISTCEWRDQYACYANAQCGRQADGACGWNATDELASCLAANQ